MKNAVFISILIILGMIATSVYGWINISADAMIARHWDLQGNVNGYSPRNQYLIGMPGLGILLTLLFIAIPAIDPRKQNIARSMGVLFVGWLGSLILIAIVHASITYAAVQGDGAQFFGISAALYATSLFLIVLGNFIAKSRSNFFVGIRTPWTLSSEHAWIMANRTAGWLCVLTGIAAAATGVALSAEDGFRVLIAGVLTMAVVSVIVSYFAWRADPDRENA